MKKRIISILLCAIMLAVLVPAAALADGSFEYTGSCTVNGDGTLVITGNASVSGGNGRANIIVDENAGNVTLNNVVANKITVNGGKVTATGSNGIYAYSVEINGGTVYARGNSAYGIRAEKSIVVTGGKVTANGPIGCVYSADELKCTLPVQQGKVTGSKTMQNATIAYGTYVVGDKSVMVLWLASTAPCEHENTRLVNEKEASCSEAGYTGDSVCDDCLITVRSGGPIAALGHVYYDGKCLRCGCIDPSERFTDTSGLIKNYRTAISWAAEKGIASGYPQSDGTVKFYPNNMCTRAHVVTFIWRANGSPEPSSMYNPFWDVSSASPFYKAILWAAEKGITTGYADGAFRPDKHCTRAHVVTFIWRSEGEPAYGYKTSLSDLNGLISDYSNAIYWAADKGVTTGYYDGTFRPHNVCTRAQVVTFLYRDKT